MKAMLLKKLSGLSENKEPLELADLPEPVPGEGEILINVSACGVCHTELDEIEGRTPPAMLPVIPGHQIVGRVAGKGKNADRFKEGDRVGVAWINSACGKCSFCLSGNENLCPDFKATGRDVNGGYAEYAVVNQDFSFLIPDVFSDFEAAPLLCAGAIGYRSLRLTGLKDGQALGLSGFGGSAHLVLKIVKYCFPDSPVYVFARSEAERNFALELGADWAGDFTAEPPGKADAVIDTTPVWKPVLDSLNCLKPGGRLVINAIRKEDTDKKALLELDYPRHLWMEKEIKSAANVTRRDVAELLQIAEEIPIKPEVQVYRLEEANRALVEMKESKIRGSKVLKINGNPVKY
jgi:propanol-preferring alcohol dehydrogenase